MKAVIIFGSSRSNGHTRMISDVVRENVDAGFVDLKSLDITPYDYEYRNSGDDFLPTITNIIENFDLLIFVTPVYWYSMSAVMKTFIDRFSDLLRVHKDLGRKLRGKNIAMVSCAHDREIYPEFHMPFKRTANYLGMNFLGSEHGYVDEDGNIPQVVMDRLIDFSNKLNSSIEA